VTPEVGELWWLKATHDGDEIDCENPRELVRVLDQDCILSDAEPLSWDVELVSPIPPDDGIRCGVGLDQFESKA
jgi:hypothetical protein